MHWKRDAGFTLVETVVAAGVLVVGIVSLSQLAVLATHITMAAGTLTTTAVMAQQKIEELRAADWDALGPSPAGTLDEDVVGYVEYLSADGGVQDEWDVAVATVFVRRWSVAALTEDTFLIQVIVARYSPASSTGGGVGDSRLTAIRSRATP